jgi:hypothetical protein
VGSTYQKLILSRVPKFKCVVLNRLFWVEVQAEGIRPLLTEIVDDTDQRAAGARGEIRHREEEQNRVEREPRRRIRRTPRNRN